MTSPLIIVGSGLAGLGVARAVRRHDPECEMILICADSGDSYSKPQLSIALSAKKTANDLILASAEEVAADPRLQLLTHTRVTHIDSSASRVELDNGESLDYSQLVLAMGSHARQLDINGEHGGRLLSVNSLQDYRNYQQQLQGKKNIAVLGGGLIGCEFANDLLVSGYNVTIIQSRARLLNMLVPAQVSQQLEKTLEANGAEIHLGRFATEVSLTESGLNVCLDNGESLDADLVISAVGVIPNISLARDSGISINRGIIVDKYLRTSVPNIYAVGDCAEVDGRVMAYVAPLMAGCKSLAATLTGTPTPVSYGPMPVAVKTTLYPIVTSPAPLGAEGHWTMNDVEGGFEALFEKNSGDLAGMTLAGSAVNRRFELTKKLPALMP